MCLFKNTIISDILMDIFLDTHNFSYISLAHYNDGLLYSASGLSHYDVIKIYEPYEYIGYLFEKLTNNKKLDDLVVLKERIICDKKIIEELKQFVERVGKDKLIEAIKTL